MNSKNEKLLSFFYSIIRDEKKSIFNQTASQRTNFLSVIIENIYQEQNASAIVRSCDCFGIQNIHTIEKDNPFSVNREIAMGAGKWITITHHKSKSNPTAQAIANIKNLGYRIVATSPNSNYKAIQDFNLRQPTAILFGSEKFGLSQTALELADEIIHIPMYGFTESFNVSVAAAVCLQILRQKLEKSNIQNWKLTEDEQTLLKIYWCRKILKNASATEREFLKSLE